VKELDLNGSVQNCNDLEEKLGDLSSPYMVWLMATFEDCQCWSWW